MQEKDFRNSPEGVEDQTAAREAEAMAHGLNLDDSVSESGFQPAEGPDASTEQKELEEARDKYLRLAAEFDNYKRRTAKERMELLQTAGKDVIQELLPVLDDFERAEKMLKQAQNVEAVKEGFDLVIAKLRNTLNRMGLRQMETNGVPFDADLHEAITEIPAPAPDMQGAVLDVVQPGYYLNDKLIRHAKVVVGK